MKAYLTIGIIASASLAVAQQQATRAYDFTDSVGVNTHFAYTDTAYYLRAPEVTAAITNLQIRHVRDGLVFGYAPPVNLYAIHANLQAAGISANLVLPNPVPLDPWVSQMEPLLVNYPDVESVEAPNEYDQSGDPAWASDLMNFMPKVWAVAQGAGSDLLAIGPSLTHVASYNALGDVSPWMDYNNLHAYFGGRNPENNGWGPPDAQWNYYGSLPYDLDFAAIDGGTKPVMTTETGYVVNDNPTQNVIPEWVEAFYQPRVFLHSWNVGIKRSYVYELIDDPSSPAGFGLMHSDLTPRPAYTAIANLMSLLSDSPAPFTPGALDYTLTGDTDGVETTLVQKSDGSFWLALWLQGSIWDVNAIQSTPLDRQIVSLTLPDARMISRVWRFHSDGNLTTRADGLNTETLSIGSGVLMLQII